MRFHWLAGKLELQCKRYPQIPQQGVNASFAASRVAPMSLGDRLLDRLQRCCDKPVSQILLGMETKATNSCSN
jgi:hypothetical protein